MLYLHAKLTASLTADVLFDKLWFDPGEVAACVWVDRSIATAIVKEDEEAGDSVVHNPSLPKTIRYCTAFLEQMR